MIKVKRIVFSLTVFLVVLTFSCLGLLCSEYTANSSLKSRIRDLEVQLAASSQMSDTFYIHDSIPVWKERIVEVDRTDYKKLLADKELIKSLQLKVAQVESENRLLIGTSDTVYLSSESLSGHSGAVLEGGLVTDDGWLSVNDSTGTVLRYHDEWADFSYFEEKRRLEYSVRDSLVTYVSREYKHRILWGLIKWGTKGYHVYHVNFNPRSRIYYNKYIRVKK